MERIRAVVDAGPVIHLGEIGSMNLISIFRCITSEEISKEVGLPKDIKVVNIAGKYKDFSKSLSERFGLHLGESQCLALAIQENIKIFLTDDLEARIIARNVNLEPHGSVGIILRAFREGLINEEKAISALNLLKTKSSLFVTSDIINFARYEIKRFRHH